MLSSRRRWLEYDVHGKQQLVTKRHTALSFGESEKKIEAMENETWKWIN